MPYIKSTARQRLACKGHGAMDAGELNYLITRELIQYTSSEKSSSALAILEENVKTIINRYCENIGFKYQTANDVVGALVSAGLELLRRLGEDKNLDAVQVLQNILLCFYDSIVAPYEDKKIQENGDVYESIGEEKK